jgi:uncharacterized membrane protein
MLLVRGKLRVITLASVGLMAALCTATTTTYAHDSIVFIVFDVPGAKFTSPASINDRGEIVGWWSSVGYLDQPHGFVRDRCGTITSFDVPGATATDVLFHQSINREGDSVGIWYGRSGEPGGFLRHRNGKITSSLVPGAATSSADSINDRGDVLGTFSDPDGTSAGFVRDEHGTVTPFNVPGAAALIPQSINNRGTSAGNWSENPDSNFFHGFVRDKTGSTTSFDVPGAMATYPASINDKGQIVGSWSATLFAFHGFLRDSDGTITLFDVAGAAATNPSSINDKGEIAGYWNDPATSHAHGFVRHVDGTVTLFDAPGAVLTIAASINAHGEIAGEYYDNANVLHGFVRVPSHREESREDCDRPTRPEEEEDATTERVMATAALALRSDAPAAPRPPADPRTRPTSGRF